MKIAREAGDAIDREVVETMLVKLGQKLDLLLRLKLDVELGPRVVGKMQRRPNVEGGATLAEIREVLNATIAKFEGDALAKTRDGSEWPPEGWGKANVNFRPQ